MNIKEKDMTVVVESLTDRIRNLETELWWRDDTIKRLKEELSEAKGGAKNG